MVYLGKREVRLNYKEIDMCIAGICAFIENEERWMEHGARENIDDALEVLELLTFVRDVEDDWGKDADLSYMERRISTGKEGDGVQ
jgi:hypothetical protein